VQKLYLISNIRVRATSLNFNGLKFIVTLHDNM